MHFTVTFPRKILKYIITSIIPNSVEFYNATKNESINTNCTRRLRIGEFQYSRQQIKARLVNRRIYSRSSTDVKTVLFEIRLTV